jgi:hypothetical protein
MRKPLPNALDIDLRGGLTDAVTPHAGTSLLIDLLRRSQTLAVAEKSLPPKKSPKGLSQGQMVESVAVLSALGGDCLDDFAGLRRDRGLAALRGPELPAAATARQGLDRFHDETLLLGRPRQGSFIPAESDALVGVRTVVQHTVRAYVSAARPERTVTLDVDAHLVESSKQTALPTYKGYRGYQPLLVCWAETGLVLADQFRDGNVPARQGISELVDEAYASLPSRPDGWQVQVRSDSAAYEHSVLDHWNQRGWTFAVSADMSRQLHQAILALEPAAWQFGVQEAGGAVREWAEVPFVPSRASECVR